MNLKFHWWFISHHTAKQIAHAYWWALMGVTVCKAKGHRQDGLAEMLGCCNRCFQAMP